MDSKYIITPDGNFLKDDELYHWGILGMRWGRRKYQNEDGSLTAAGRERYDVGDGREKRGGDRSSSIETNPRKSRSNATDDGRSERVNKKAAVKAKKIQEKIEKQEAKLEKQESKLEKLEKQTVKSNEANNNDTTRELRTKLDGKSLDEISDKNLKARLERMGNEDRYDKAMAERGYIQVEKYSDMDRKISELKKQKEYTDLLVALSGQSEMSELNKQKALKELQRDIAKIDDEMATKNSKLSKLREQKEMKQLEQDIRNFDKDPKISDLERRKTTLTLERDVRNLENELNPKKTNPLVKIGGQLITQAAVPAVTSAGKKVLEKWLTEKGMELLGVAEADKAKDKVADKVKDKTEAIKEKTKKAKDKLEKEEAGESTKKTRGTRGSATNIYNTYINNGSNYNDNSSNNYDGGIFSKTINFGTGSSNKSKKNESNNSSSGGSSEEKVYEGEILKDKQKNTSDSSSSSKSKKTYYYDYEDDAYNKSPVSGYLSSGTISSGRKTVSGYLSAPASSNSSIMGVTTRIRGLKATGNYTNAEIADKLGISESTLNRYLYGGDN